MKKIISLIFQLLLTLTLSAQSQVKVTTANLNLRTNPTIYSGVTAVIPKDTQLTVDYSSQYDSEWIIVNYNGRTGYVSSKYLKGLSNTSKTPKYKEKYAKNSSTVRYYNNTYGKKVQSPTYYESPPNGATALCRDGTYSFSRSSRGTCSRHGGVDKWLK